MMRVERVEESGGETQVGLLGADYRGFHECRGRGEGAARPEQLA